MTRAQKIIRAACAHFRVNLHEHVMAGSRSAATQNARAAIAYLLHERCNMSYPEIAMQIGMTSHSTMHTAAQRWTTLLESDREALSAAVDEIQAAWSREWRLGKDVAALAGGLASTRT